MAQPLVVKKDDDLDEEGASLSLSMCVCVCVWFGFGARARAWGSGLGRVRPRRTQICGRGGLDLGAIQITAQCVGAFDRFVD